MNFAHIKKLALVRRYRDHSGQLRCCGGPDLRKSERYPAGLALKVACLVSQVRRSKKPLPDSGLLLSDTDSDASDSGLESILK